MFSPCRGATLAFIALAGACARYQPEPFDAAEHRARWFERGPELADAAEFARSLGAAAPEAAAFDPADGLTLAEAELAGLVYNGALRSARARLKIAEAGAKYAGLPPDPSLNLSLLRILDASVDPWVAAADAAISLPLWGTLSAEKERAKAHLEAEAWRALDGERKFARELRHAWIEWSACTGKAGEARRQMEAMEQASEIARGLADAGELRRAEARLFSMARARMDLDLHHYTHEAEEHVTRIKVMIGLRPEAPAKLVPALEAGAADAAARAAQEEVLLIDRHPLLRAARIDYEAAERALERAVRAAAPAPEAGPSAELDEGSERIGASARIPLPLWNRDRREIAEAEAARAAAKIGLEAESERLAGELALARAKVHAAEADWRMTAEQLAPLADEQLREARALAELGEFDAPLTLEALKQSYETKIAVIDSRAELARANADLLHIVQADAPTMLKEALHEEAQ